MRDYINPIPDYKPAANFAANSTANFEEFSERIITAIKENKSEMNLGMNLDSRGIWYIIRNKNVKVKHINKRVWK
jgi:hypothetical protein